MRRTTVWLSEQQITKLKKLSKHKGLAIAELIRRFIDDGLEKGETINADRKESRKRI
jgi:predicted DNA-binding protein